MKISEVTQGLVEGKMFRRTNWPESHFIFRQVPSTISSDIVPKMQSLPQSVKDFFIRTFEEDGMTNINYSDQICYVGNGNNLINFAFQAADVLAENWEECS